MTIEKGSYLAITGRFQSFTRDVGIFFIEALGCHYQPFVSRQTTVLIRGYFSVDLFDETKESKKLKLAKEKDLPILNEMAFLHWIIACLSNLSVSDKALFGSTHEEELRTLLPESDGLELSELVSQLIHQLEKKITVV